MPKWILPLLLFAGATPLLAQTPASQPDQTYVPTLVFDVASVRQSAPAESFSVGGYFVPRSSSITLTNNSFENLLRVAYGSDRFYKISGLPESFGWQTHFNIQAKADSAADEKLSSLTKDQAYLEQKHMMQQLLADRFHLKVHWETREGEIFNLVARNPARLRDAKGETMSPAELTRWGDRTPPPLYQRGDSRTGFDFIAHQCTMTDIVTMLTFQVGRPVVDTTGLSGKYDFVLRYLGGLPSHRDENDTRPIPTLDVAIQDQLGLKLESAKGPIPVLVVDHVEKPTEN